MTTPHPELGRRVERNTNDIEAIYEILTQHGAKLDEHTAKLDEHTAKLDEILRRLPEAS